MLKAVMVLVTVLATVLVRAAVVVARTPNELGGDLDMHGIHARAAVVVARTPNELKTELREEYDEDEEQKERTRCNVREAGPLGIVAR